MKAIFGILVLVGAVMATPLEIAVHTGRSEQFTTITGKQAIHCEYELSGRRKFWKAFLGVTCPPTVNVQ